jgi:cold shock CspA family protein
MGGEMSGAVSWFSVERGLGAVVGNDGVTYPLHCTQIADGSRVVDEGVQVTFDLLRKLGQVEATNVRAI